MTALRLSLPGRQIDRYLLVQLVRPLCLSLAFVLVALLIERILRLVDLVATQGGPFGAVVTMAASLLPHYLGLALPAAFFLSILVVVSRLSEGCEIDAILSSGVSLRRTVVPFLLAGALLAILSVVLLNYVQPHARYAYRAALHSVTHAGWTGVVAGGTFVDADGLMFHAAQSDRSGRMLSNILIEERGRGGDSITTTAAEGMLSQDPEQAHRLILTLRNGSQLRVSGEGTRLLRFDHLTLERRLSLEGTIFRPRGNDEREMTLAELWRGLRDGNGPVRLDTLRAELHGRLVRAASVVALPLLAMPMGMAAKRQRRGAAVMVAAVILLLYHHLLQVGQGLVELGRLTPAIGLWLPFILLVGGAAWTLLRMSGRPGQGPMDDVLAAVDRTIAFARQHVTPRRDRRP